MEVNINLTTTQYNEAGEKNTIKSSVSGTLYEKKSGRYVIYKEKEDGQETTTSIKIENDKLTITRFGALNSTLIFKNGYTHTSNYVTPQGAFNIENTTKKLTILETKNIYIDIDYDIKIMGMFSGRNVINIKIESK